MYADKGHAYFMPRYPRQLAPGEMDEVARRVLRFLAEERWRGCYADRVVGAGLSASGEGRCGEEKYRSDGKRNWYRVDADGDILVP